MPPEAPLAPGRGRRKGTLADDLRRLTQRYGWRAYFVPVLVVVTIVALLNTGAKGAPADPHAATSSHAGGSAAPRKSTAPPVASASAQVKVDQPGANVLGQVEDSAALPPGADYTAQGTGTFSVIPGTTAVVGAGPLRRYTIEYENGITGIDVSAAAKTIDATLDDPRSWTGNGAFSLQRVDSGAADFRITLTSSLTVRTLCGYTQQIETSCFDPANDNRVVLNDSRWVRGAVAYANDITTYHQYMINHEVGHALGFEHVYSCLPGGKAPTMMQQTITVQATDGTMCQPNPWPNPV
jgi:hypothetical protein